MKPENYLDWSLKRLDAKITEVRGKLAEVESQPATRGVEAFKTDYLKFLRFWLDTLVLARAEKIGRS